MSQLSRLFGLTEKTTEEIKQIPVDKIVPNPYQPRTVFDEEKIDELCQTIKTHGIIQPIVVRIKDDVFELIAGERRWRAFKKLEIKTIPAVIKDFNDSQSASIALIENMQREGLTALEEAVAYKNLMEMYDLTQESLAQRLGKGQSTIANKLRLLNLSLPIQEALLTKAITERHARALLSLKNEELELKLLKDIVEKELNVKQTEDRVKALLDKQEDNKKTKPKRVAFSRDMRLAMNTIRQSVDMVIETGLAIETDERDHEDFYEFIIKIPKK